VQIAREKLEPDVKGTYSTTLMMVEVVMMMMILMIMMMIVMMMVMLMYDVDSYRGGGNDDNNDDDNDDDNDGDNDSDNDDDGDDDDDMYGRIHLFYLFIDWTSERRQQYYESFTEHPLVTALTSSRLQSCLLDYYSHNYAVF
jgi:hypothetical protein